MGVHGVRTPQILALWSPQLGLSGHRRFFGQLGQQ